MRKSENNKKECCFNRYMVECESSGVWTIGYGHTGFNRYMVECE